MELMKRHNVLSRLGGGIGISIGTLRWKSEGVFYFFILFID